MSTVTLKNAKGEGDFLRLRFWGTVLLMLGALLAFSAGSAFAAPLAGTNIGNQASASYKDFNNVDRITVSNSVSTIVQTIGSATLTQSQSKIGAPGQTLSFPHTILNTGNSVATFGVTVGNVVTPGTFSPAPSAASIYADANCDGLADNNTAVTTVGPAAPGGQACFVVQATLGPNGTGSFDVSFTSSIAGSTLTGSPNTDTVTVSANAVINVTKSISTTTGPSGTIVTYQLTYRNTGTVSAGTVVVADKLPSGATYIAGSGRWSVTTGTALTDAATDFEGTAPNRIDYGTDGLATGGSVVAILERVDPGSQGVIQFQALMNGTTALVNNQASWCYSDIGTGGTIIAGTVQANCTNIRGTFGAGALVTADITAITGVSNTNQSNIVPFNIPSIGATGVARITDSNANTDGTNPGNTAASTLIPTGTNVVGDDLIVTTAGQGTLATWDAFVFNAGTGTDSFNITVTSSTGAAPNFPAGTTFLLFRSDGATPLTDSNNDGILDTGPLAPGANYAVRVVAILPPSGVGGVYDAIIQAQSTNTITSLNTVAVRANIVGSRVDLTNYGGGGATQSAAGAGGPITTVTANPGTVATFGLIVTNTGSVADSYDLSYNVGTGAYSAVTPFAFTAPGVLPSGYSLAFYRDTGTTCAPAQRGAQLNNTGVIAPLGTVNVCALVTIPNGASVATTQLFFRALSPTTFSGNFIQSSGDVKNDALTINTFRTVAITPNNNGQIFPGGSVQYCHTVTNGGNVSETLTVTQTAQSLFTAGAAGWAQFATVYADTNKNCVLDGTESATPLTLTVVGAQAYLPGSTTNFIVVVQAPLAASAGQSNGNLFTLTAAVAGVTGNLVATDTTTVVVGQVQLVKQQVLDPSATCATAMSLAGVGALTYAQTQITAGALPGRCVVYQVTATNVGTQSVTNVTINDVAPPNTTLNGVPFCNTTLQPACTVGGVNPAVSSTVTPLAGGASTVFYFRVQINP